MARSVAPGDQVIVRLALLPGMDRKFNPDANEILRMKLSLQDPAAMQQLLREQRQERDDAKLNADRIAQELYLFPRQRTATVAYVDRLEGKSTGFVNLDVFTPGSPIMQGAVGKIPNYAQQHFRLDRVQFFVREPDGGHDQHVCFWAPEEDEESPVRVSEVEKK